MGACSDDDDNITGGVVEVKKQIVKYDGSALGDDIFEFKYDSKHTLSSFVQYYGRSEMVINYALTFDSENKLQSLKKTRPDGRSTTREFTYSANKLVVKNIYAYYEGDVYEYTDTLHLNANGLVIKIIGDLSEYFIEYEYDEKGNIIRYFETSKEGGKILQGTYKYDDKKCLFSNQGLPQWFWVYFGDGLEVCGGQNNLKEAAYKDGSEDIIVNVEYVYDNEGYPLRGFLKGEPDVAEVMTYQVIK
ncbi:hypothetical protein AwDysgo_02950 [Bacteroidales bacterium]|nr:hypothetical protein AwDysgo_02950 [Bacteroidales bacterium]